MNHLFCPKCESIYTGENINRKTDTAQCDSCRIPSRFSEVLKWNQEKTLEEQDYFDSLNEDEIVKLVNEINQYQPIHLDYSRDKTHLTHTPQSSVIQFLKGLMFPIVMIIFPLLVFIIPLLFGIMIGGVGVFALGGIFLMGTVLIVFRVYKYFLNTKRIELITLSKESMSINTKYMLRFSLKKLSINTISHIQYSQEFVEEPEESSTQTYQVNVLRIISTKGNNLVCLDKVPVKIIKKIAMVMSYFLKDVNV